MKSALSTFLILICAVLVIALIAVKHGDNVQHDTDTGSIADFSNRLDSAQLDIATRDGRLYSLSNSLDEARTAVVTFSNQWLQAQSDLAIEAEQITNLNQQLAAAKAGNQSLQATLNQTVMDLTNQMAGLVQQITATRAGLDQANKDYSLLENRFRRDVAERLVVERKFNNPQALQAQMDYLKTHPAGEISTETIYAGLDVEVKSNAVHVIAPD